MMKIRICWSLLLVLILTVLGMPNAHCQSDNVTLTYKEFLENILDYHPVAKKADLQIRLAETKRLDARGILDPIISSDWSQKNFNNKLYYRQYQANMKLPTILGLDFIGGYENTEGVFLNPENSTDEFGLWHVGAELNILQGLITNERRTALDQAKVFQELAKSEQRIILNDLVYNASAAYLTWQQFASNKLVFEENVAISNIFFENTKQSFLSGEKTAMDTLEAFILYQDALVYLQKNQSRLTKSTQNVENFLWFKESPLTLKENIQPDNYKNLKFPTQLNMETADLSTHPMILAAVNKLSYTEIEQKLKREKLKPQLKIKYNFLLSTDENVLSPSYSSDDYVWGFDFSMPLLYRSERADVQRGEIKIQEIELDIQDKRNEIQNKIDNSWLQQQLLQEQAILLDQNVESYRRLLKGENELFNFGESSVFLLNKRQEKYIDGQLKLIEVYMKRQMELLNFLYYSNQLVY